MAPIVVYIAGFRQHAGKTVTSLGILSCLRKVFNPADIAYIKPVGQELVKLEDGTRVDKDALLLRSFSGIPGMDPKEVSPVRLGHGFTQHYLSAGDQLSQTRKLEDYILRSFTALSAKKVIVAEGSGHPGVGGIVGISNADVANLLKADIVFLSGGGIGKALDMLEVDLSYFLYKRSRVRGILFNKIIPEKMDTISRYITEDLLNRKYGAFGGPLRILGFLPEVEQLARPSMRAIAEMLDGCEPIGDQYQPAWTVPCRSLRIIALDYEHLKLEHYIQPRDILILVASSHRRLHQIAEYHRSLRSQGGLGGLVLTCGLTEVLDNQARDEILGADLPALLVQKDTGSTERRLLQIYESIKLQAFDTEKIREIEKLFETHFDFEKFLDTFRIPAAIKTGA